MLPPLLLPPPAPLRPCLGLPSCGPCAAMEPPEVVEAEASEDLGFFFKRLGELCFSPASAQSHPGPASSLAVAPAAGAVFFSDAAGKGRAQR